MILIQGEWLVQKPPIAMQCENNAVPFMDGSGWSAVLRSKRPGDDREIVWTCKHNHPVESEAQECARKAWFAHHGQ